MKLLPVVVVHVRAGCRLIEPLGLLDVADLDAPDVAAWSEREESR